MSAASASAVIGALLVVGFGSEEQGACSLLNVSPQVCMGGGEDGESCSARCCFPWSRVPETHSIGWELGEGLLPELHHLGCSVFFVQTPLAVGMCCGYGGGWQENTATWSWFGCLRLV